MRQFSARSRWRWRLQGVAGNRVLKFTKKPFPKFGERLFVFASNVLPICSKKYRQTDCPYRAFPICRQQTLFDKRKLFIRRKQNEITKKTPFFAAFFCAIFKIKFATKPLRHSCGLPPNREP